jgi:N-methylhydantoinase B
MSRCLLASQAERGEAMACWTGSSMAPIAAGVSQHGFPFVNTEMSHFAGGGGARVDEDGVDTGGIVFNTTPNIANVETIEQDFPLLYLFRRHLTDSGGPGRHRGGASGELAYVVHDAPAGQLEVAFSGTGAEMPNAVGLSGGLPGAAIRVLRVRGNDVSARLAVGASLPATLEEVSGTVETMPQKHPRTPFVPGDVWYHHWQGGAGYGDPLDREPEAVASDVRRHLTSPAAAPAIYGVVLGPDGTVDRDATARERARLREARRRSAEAPERPVDTMDPAPLGSGWAITEYVEIVRGSRLTRCRRCGHGLARDGADHAAGCLRQRAPLTAAGPNRGEAYDRGRFALAFFYCPGCLTLLETEVVQDGAPRATYALSID